MSKSNGRAIPADEVPLNTVENHQEPRGRHPSGTHSEPRGRHLSGTHSETRCRHLSGSHRDSFTQREVDSASLNHLGMETILGHLPNDEGVKGWSEVENFVAEASKVNKLKRLANHCSRKKVNSSSPHR